MISWLYIICEQACSALAAWMSPPSLLSSLVLLLKVCLVVAADGEHMLLDAFVS
jgi:hypothetical protein